MVNPEMEAVTPLSTWKTRLRPPPLIVTPAAGPVIVKIGTGLLNSSWPPVTVIVCPPVKTAGSKLIAIGAGERIRQAHGSGQGQLGRIRVDRPGSRLDDQAGLEGADVDQGATSQAALVGRDAAHRVPLPIAGLPGKRAIVWVGPP